MKVVAPADEAGIVEVVAACAAEGTALEILGGGSKRGLGRAVTAPVVLSMRCLAGVSDYDPAEMVVTARAGTGLAEIETLLAGSRQMLGFEPAGWHVLTGEGVPTLGGVVAANVAGPRRVRAGAARDHVLGLRAVNGFGAAWKAGGRVVKNVSGFDMCKLQAGAFGTLSVLTELTLRTLPKPETEATVFVPVADAAAAVAAMALGLNLPHEVSAAAYLPPYASRRAGLPGAGVLLRVEGFAPSVAARAALVRGHFAQAEIVAEAPWADIGAVRALLPAGIVWRVCTAPSAAHAAMAALGKAFGSAAMFLDWGGGLLWLSIEPDEAGADAGAARVRGAFAGGHATLMAAPAAMRAAVEVFQPEAPAVAALAARVRRAFDPALIFNRGRMRAEG